jgi:hypothetical protein
MRTKCVLVAQLFIMRFDISFCFLPRHEKRFTSPERKNGALQYGLTTQFDRAGGLMK